MKRYRENKSLWEEDMLCSAKYDPKPNDNKMNFISKKFNNQSSTAVYEVDVEDALRVKRYTLSKSIVWRPIDQLVKEAIPDIKITIQQGANTYAPNMSMQNFVRKHIVPFVRDATMRSFSTGVIAWSTYNSNGIEFPIPTNARDGSYKLHRVWFGDRSSLKGIRNDGNMTSYGSSGSNTQIIIGATGLKPRKSNRGIKVTPVGSWQPGDEGELMAPLNKVFHDVVAFYKLWGNYMDDSDGFSQPLAVYGTSQQNRSSGSNYAQFAMSGTTPEEMVNNSMRQSHLKDPETEVKEARSAAAAVLLNTGGIEDPSHPDEECLSRSKLNTNRVNLKPDKVLQQVIYPQAIPEFSAAQREVRTRILECLGVPPQMHMSGDDVKAAYAEQLKTMYEDSKRAIQQQMAPAVEEIMEYIFRDVMDPHRRNFAFQMEKTLKRPVTGLEVETIKSEICIKVEFIMDKQNKFEDLLLLNQNYVIGHDVFALRAADVAGIPRDQILLDKAAVMNEAKLKKAITEAETPDTSEGESGAKKPAKTSSSSKGGDGNKKKSPNKDKTKDKTSKTTESKKKGDKDEDEQPKKKKQKKEDN